MKASLKDIEKAVRSNFTIVSDGKFLETGGDRGERRFRSAARMVFVGMAPAFGHTVEEILQYTNIDVREFNSLFTKYHEYRERGKKKMERRCVQGRKRYTEMEGHDPDLRIYRKTILITNHILTIKRQRVNML